MKAINGAGELLLLTSITICLNTFVSGLEELKLSEDTDFGGKVCDSDLKSEGVSLIQCAALCAMDDSCASTFYTGALGICTRCTQVYTDPNDPSLLTEADSKYHRPLQTDQGVVGSYGSPCTGTWALTTCDEPNTVCYPEINICVCHPGYVYSPVTGACILGCSEFGATYQRYPRSILLSNDLFEQPDMTNVTDCLLICTSLAHCYGVDYDHVNNVCFYNDKTVSAAANKWRVDNPSHDFYARNCL